MDNLQLIKNKIINTSHLSPLTSHLHPWKDMKVVFTNGCFDILHRGHVEYLAKAADMGDVLVVGLNTDASVRRLKGEGRPVNNEEARALVLASLSISALAYSSGGRPCFNASSSLSSSATRIASYLARCASLSGPASSFSIWRSLIGSFTASMKTSPCCLSE